LNWKYIFLLSFSTRSLSFLDTYLILSVSIGPDQLHTC